LAFPCSPPLHTDHQRCQSTHAQVGLPALYVVGHTATACTLGVLYGIHPLSNLHSGVVNQSEGEFSHRFGIVHADVRQPV
jgi:hypothetical protein